jgi:hypothetical protein
LRPRDADIKAEIVDLFAVKLLNFIRNPFCIEEVLNSSPGIASYEPADPELLATYGKIVTGRKPHQAHLCRQLGISGQMYIEWLRPLFILLMYTGDGRLNLFEDVIKGLLENRGTRHNYQNLEGLRATTQKPHESRADPETRRTFGLWPRWLSAINIPCCGKLIPRSNELFPCSAA